MLSVKTILSVFSVLGNLAPVLEVVAGAHLERAHRALLWLLLLPAVYVVNALICCRALFDLVLARKCRWFHTPHNGTETRRRRWRRIAQEIPRKEVKERNGEM